MKISIWHALKGTLTDLRLLLSWLIKVILSISNLTERFAIFFSTILNQSVS